MKISSTAFGNGQPIPRAYTCDDNDRYSPPLSFSDIPSGAQSLVLIMDDPDAPGGTFTHWVLFDIPPATTSLSAGSTAGTTGRNQFGDTRYTGPCPPNSTHHYRLTLYAVDRTLELGSSAKRDEVEYFAKKHALATAQLIGTYSRD